MQYCGMIGYIVFPGQLFISYSCQNRSFSIIIFKCFSCVHFVTERVTEFGM